MVPVKALSRAKTRLALDLDHRRALALAFAEDTVAALSGSPLVAEVLVVTSDQEAARRLERSAVRVIAEEDAGLRAAVAQGLRVAESTRRYARTVVCPADLPCLRAAEVTAVLDAVPPPLGAFVPDRAGTGTTLVVCPPGRSGGLRYGPDSARRHRRLGLRPLADAPDRVRHDVDTLVDLEDARALGVGTHTAAALILLDWQLDGRFADAQPAR